MNYADIKQFDVANGLGVRVSLFVSGCTHHCKGCFNEVAWDFKYGTPFTEETIEQIIAYLKPNHVAGLTILGGEPLEPANQKGLLPLLRRVKEVYPKKDIWMFSGYTFDTDIVGRMCNTLEETKEILSLIDILVDGKFEEEKKSLSLRFRGSSNQRIIKVQDSLRSGNVELWEGMNL
ncbi:MAG: anaerobic ribonucleoside-triphosphate reductase activating protein [bacterium]|nr:anaerobic ribonucleoside-triphosphate reductase activating protein [bacterium]